VQIQATLQQAPADARGLGFRLIFRKLAKLMLAPKAVGCEPWYASDVAHRGL
jgi:hypothetical protein